VAAATLDAIQETVARHGSFAVSVDGNSVGAFDMNVKDIQAVLNVTKNQHHLCNAVYVQNASSWTKVGRGIACACGYDKLMRKIVLK
jgi:hypothetical protein